VASEKANRTRENISESIDDAKNKAKSKVEDYKERHTA
jgi:hypothetical protein